MYDSMILLVYHASKPLPPAVQLKYEYFSDYLADVDSCVHSYVPSTGINRG